MKTWLWMIGSMWCAGLAAQPVAADARIAIVIDDLGYLEVNDHAVLELDRRIAVAIIPDGPLAPALARRAFDQNREALMHLPLAGMIHDNCEFEAVCLGIGWSAGRMDRHLEWAASRVEHAVGINNHQGSRFTSDPQAVGNLVRAIDRFATRRDQPLFVLDSRTTSDTLLEREARKAGLATGRRHVFLDNERCPEAIADAWESLLTKARTNGSAIAIGHPHTETIAFLAGALPGLDQAGVRLVPVSELMGTDGSDR